MIREFVIPVNKDELLQSSRSGQFYVERIIPIRVIPQALDEARTALQTNGPDFIIDHFETFFAVAVHGNKIELPIVMRAFSRISKGIETLVNDMENTFDKGSDVPEENRQRLLNITKMLAYLFSWYVCHIEDEMLKNANKEYTNKRKKNVKSDAEQNWEDIKDKALEYVYRWLQLPLHKLWQPPIVEDAFVTLLTKVCYKVLEQCKEAKQKHVRQTIFEILGTAIRKYNQGITCVVRIIQLVKLDDVLATRVASGVIHMVKECGCTGLIREVLKEIDQCEPAEAESRNISVFLENIGVTEPGLIIPILDDIMDNLSSEFYNMRNCAIGILGAVVHKSLTGENLTQEQKDQRDECLNCLEDHILDCNAYVRSKTLQVWQQLCCEGAIPLARQTKVLAATALRLEDRSANVRKQALQLLRALLQGNPFAAKLNKTEISKSFEKAEHKLRKMQSEYASKSARGDNQRLELWNSLLPDVKKAIKQFISDNDKNKDSEEDGEDEEVEEETSPDKAFERVRQLMLNRKILQAVTHLWKVCNSLKQIAEVEDLTTDAKEECLFLLLLKTFMESEDNINDTEKPAEPSKQSTPNDQEKEEIEAQKRVVNYLKNCLEFAVELEAAIPMAKHLLFSTTAGDAVEACTLLGTAHQFGVAGSTDGIRDALFQVFHRDQSVRNNVAKVYKEIYLQYNENEKSERQQAHLCVKALIELLKGLQPGQSQALNQLIVTWYKNQELNSEVLQILWEKFSGKSPETTSVDGRAALMLITMISQAQNGIITDNLEVLIKVGFGPRAKTDLLLARDTCRALLQIKHEAADIEKPAVRYPNDHNMFKEIITLLSENFMNAVEDGYISFATDAIGVVYHLANQPDHLMKELLLDILDRTDLNNNNNCTQQSVVPFFVLSKLLYLVGHIAIKQMVHLDTAVYKELRRRNLIRDLKKGKSSKLNGSVLNKSRTCNTSPAVQNSARKIIRNKEASTVIEDNGEEAVVGAADDTDAEFIHATLENEIINGTGMLSKFVPLVLDVCQHPEKYNNEDVQASGVLALSKMMTVSSLFCQESLQLLVTILERSPNPGIRANVLIGISDLTSRFPNETEPWMKHVYGRLRDKSVKVRSTCIRVLSNLIMREMIRVRGQVSELALCIIDDNKQICEDSKQFFNELSQKGNALYNVMPDILSRLTDPEQNLDEDHFQEIIKFILGLLHKEKQLDGIIEKICARFKLATTERQWRDFAYCLSLLEFSPKSIHSLIESLPLLKEKIHNAQVLKALRCVIEQTKKKPLAKAACIELEEKIQNLLEGTEESKDNDCQSMPPPPAPKRRKSRRSRKHKKDSSSEEEEDNSDSDSETTDKANSTPRGKKPPNRKNATDSSPAIVQPPAKRGKQMPTLRSTPQRMSTRLSQSQNRD